LGHLGKAGHVLYLIFECSFDVIMVIQIKRGLPNQSLQRIYLPMRKVMKDNTRDVVTNLRKGEGRRRDILIRNQIALLSQRLNHLILRVILILTQVTHLMSAAQVMTGEGAERDTRRKINASVQEESVTIGAKEGVGSVTGNQNISQKGLLILLN
jgi:hypothetical protein